MYELQISTGKLQEGTSNQRTKLVSENHKIGFDNYFHSVDFEVDFLTDRTYVYGTIDKGRKMLSELKTYVCMKRSGSDFKVTTNGKRKQQKPHRPTENN